MLTDEFGHFEHADLLLAAEDGSQIIVSIDHGPLLFVLKTFALDVHPELFGDLRPRHRRGTDYGGEHCAGLHRPHEGCIRFALLFCYALFGLGLLHDTFFCWAFFLLPLFLPLKNSNLRVDFTSNVRLLASFFLEKTTFSL